MKRKNKFYKVLLYDHKDSFLSVTDLSPLRYEVGKWTLPSVKGSKLFAFPDVRYARQFAAAEQADCIYECECRNPRRCDFLILDPQELDLSNSRPTSRFWKTRSLDPEKSRTLLSYLRKAPSGTVIADSIKLVKEVSLLPRSYRCKEK